MSLVPVHAPNWEPVSPPQLPPHGHPQIPGTGLAITFPLAQEGAKPGVLGLEREILGLSVPSMQAGADAV